MDTPPVPERCRANARYLADDPRCPALPTTGTDHSLLTVLIAVGLMLCGGALVATTRRPA